MFEKEFSYNNALTSARKASLVNNLMVGFSAKEAIKNLEFSDKKASKFWKKLLKSGLDYFEKQGIDDVFVSKVHIGPAPSYKRVRYGSRTHIHPLIKRRANLYLKLASNTDPKKGS